MEKELSNKKEKALNQNTRVNKDKLSDDMIRVRVRDVESDTATARKISDAAIEILRHRDGTLFEDLAFVDSVSYRTRINKDYDFYDEKTAQSGCKPNKPMWDLLHNSKEYTIIAIHNHPNSAAVSINDIARCFERQYKYGLVFCHSGVIYKYYVNEKYNPNRYYACTHAVIDRNVFVLYNYCTKRTTCTL